MAKSVEEPRARRPAARLKQLPRWQANSELAIGSANPINLQTPKRVALCQQCDGAG
jgi:hypothetical protein